MWPSLLTEMPGALAPQNTGLIQQLSSSAGDGYTVAQATYAANHVGL